jgi:hypothetical protein
MNTTTCFGMSHQHWENILLKVITGAIHNPFSKLMKYIYTTQIIKCHCVEPFIVLLITPHTMKLHRHFIILHLMTSALISSINFKNRIYISPKIVCKMVFA